MNYLIDTCVISEIVRNKPDARVRGWLSSVEESRLFLSVITLGELEKGVLKLQAGRKRQTLETWIRGELAERFEGRILPVDALVARAWGALLAEGEARGRPLPAIDGLLAATAAVHQMTLVTRDAGILSSLDVSVFNPWK